MGHESGLFWTLTPFRSWTSSSVMCSWLDMKVCWSVYSSVSLLTWDFCFVSSRMTDWGVWETHSDKYVSNETNPNHRTPQTVSTQKAPDKRRSTFHLHVKLNIQQTVVDQLTKPDFSTQFSDNWLVTPLMSFFHRRRFQSTSHVTPGGHVVVCKRSSERISDYTGSSSVTAALFI